MTVSMNSSSTGDWYSPLRDVTWTAHVHYDTGKVRHVISHLKVLDSPCAIITSHHITSHVHTHFMTLVNYFNILFLSCQLSQIQTKAMTDTTLTAIHCACRVYYLVLPDHYHDCLSITYIDTYNIQQHRTINSIVEGHHIRYQGLT